MEYRQLYQEEFDDISKRILYEDNHILIINKRIGEIVQGDKTGDEPLSETLKAFIAMRDNKPGRVFMGVPHRLDRPVSGIALFAKTSKCLERMNEAFRNGSVHKTYWALTGVKPEPEEGILKHYLVRNEKLNKSFAYDEYARPVIARNIEPDVKSKNSRANNLMGTGKAATNCRSVITSDTDSSIVYKSSNESALESNYGKKPVFPAGAKEARLEYKLIKSFDRYYLIEVVLLTGRHHQIRCQLAAIGCPIKGDLKYGSPRSNKDGGINLHARSITFTHPTRKEEISVIAPVDWQPFISE